MHAILFGHNFNNQKKIKTINGNPIFTSPELEKLWPYGYHSIGEANEKTAYYIASYALKSNTKEEICEVSGEIRELKDQMNVSKNPGIGLEYFIRNSHQIVESGEIPRYYMKKLEQPEWCRAKYPHLSKYIDKFDMLLDIAERKKFEQFHQRSDREIYAQYIIDNQKLNNQSSAYRKSVDSSKNNLYKRKEQEIKKRYLKENADNYARLTKE